MMEKNIARYLAAALAFLAQLTPASAREILPIDTGWRFSRANVVKAETTDQDDTSWQQVTLPHTFNAKDGDDGGNDYYRGPAWYRLHVDLTFTEDRRVFIEFGAATLTADVYVNGRYVGRHEGGFSAFRFDITNFTKSGSNLIAVRVNNARDKTVAPIGGDFTVFGGLIRPVRLILTGPIHLDLLDDGGPGVYVTTTKITPTAAELSVATRISNDTDVPVSKSLHLFIRNAKGAVVAQTVQEISLKAHETIGVRTFMRLHHPHLWDGVRDPYLYRMNATIAGDQVTVPLGVRSFRVDPDHGFILNGSHYDLHGVNYFHAQRPGKGPAVGAPEIDADFTQMQELGVTGIRMAHFQHPQRAYDDADRMGFAVWTEVPLNMAYDPSSAFLANVKKQMRELIVQNFNHPSVVVWGIGNELRVSDQGSNRLLAAAAGVVKTTDPSRLSAYAHCCLDDDDPLTKHSDLLAFNRYWGLYEGPDTLHDIGPWADKLHAARPDRPFGISEYGGCAAVSQQEDPPSRPKAKSPWHPEQYQTKFHEAYWTRLEKRPYLWTKFIWQMFDSAVDSRSDGATPGINDKGLVSYDRKTRKDAFFWYKANWSKKPFVYITSRRFTPRKDAKANIKVFTNLKSVTLWLNGRLIGKKNADGHMALWDDIDLKLGDNRIIARSHQNDTTYEDRVVWRLEP